MEREHNGSVLIVDDEQPVRDSIGQVLRAFGYDVLTVDGVPAAMETMSRLGKKIWCIVTDFQMPGFNGIEFIHCIRRHPVSPPVILLTAHGDLELAVAAIRGGAFDFLTKPVDFQELRQSIDRAFRFYTLLMLEKEFALELEDSVLGMTRALRENEEKLSELTEQLLTVEEQERHRIATELHDNIGQGLAFTKMKLMKIRTASNDTESIALLQKAVESIDTAIQSVRTLTTQISPPLLYDVGFEAALECLADTLRAEHGLFVEIRSAGAQVAIPEKERVILFTAVRELLINVIKHAEVNRAAVSIIDDEHGVVIEVSDNGAGFDFGIKTPGFGLFSIRQKMLRVGGSVTITSAIGKGTVTRLVLPKTINTQGA